MDYEFLLMELEFYAAGPEVTHATADLLYEAVDAIKSLKADAGRYAYIRNQMGSDDVNLLQHLIDKDLDSFIDEKMKEQND